MFLLNIKLAFRNIVRNKSFTVINSLGLSIGLTTFLLIMLYVKYEKSYDSFFGKHDRIYRVYMDYIIGGEYSAGDAQTYNGSAELLKINFAEVEDAVRLYQIDKVTFSLNNEIFQEQNGHVTDPSYFNTFAPDLIKGDINTALSVPNQIVLCKNLATRIFGKEDPVGKTITAFNDQDKTILTVAGVMKNIPENTHQKTNFLISYETLKTWPVAQYETNWNNNNFFTYILLKEDADPVQFKNKLLAFDDKLEDERHNFEPITDIHLLSNKPYEAEINGNAQRVRYLFAIAFIVVILSWLNYINLSFS